MQAPTERDVTSVILQYREGTPSLRPFYCLKCGKCVCEVFGDAYLVVPGIKEPVDLKGSGVRTAVNCGGFIRKANGDGIRCDAKYAF